ncbi:UDP-N-acetylmuramate--L-alanine ligase [Leuconostoc falkenbergense]|uniref:UDP-N-acetylmuramate--L-alanine ligase n=1 Tax=Leuconostoc falkenbergense TaxID=2766470 RepID=A0A9X3IPJ8_9LACO|nr:UDP-N-acetylmuramate--L-alanine ligase [Leuconostoc falkenbergense]VTU55415.1 UDP-N-acetylmuramate--L-alanine ligase [Lactobacillus oligofermentans DSM = LMG 22743] [Leuconostoc pseudomesenteroides]MCT4411254.1 UDP-N-acetylmuramate--L-alanine ligase [Leuconostoc falkenbergense]MCX7579173.1 UDP-N-acetylmuramate--L-alanine ligase [Leuconostoc falkenbergense]MDM7645801.1 UDP-N-acetylmuramate--L-alanine ligase [Leuconostoc falkenbergense]MDV3546022.1 UDP-N-acetylmuramate--L-alanine ligase [Leuc
MSKQYYFIGIKGTGMGPLAQILHDQGNEVLGSDIDTYTYTQAPLEAAGIKILPFEAKNVDEYQSAVFVRGNAFEDTHVEVARALELGVKMISYPEAVQEQIAQTTSIAVAGAHGKTSTTGLLAHVLKNIAPTSYLIGDGTGRGVPNSQFFVVEADEYRRHFKDYRPDYAILTNIDFDHPDYYTGIEDVTNAFADFANNVKKGIFAWGDDEHLHSLKPDADVYYYGVNPDKDDFVATNIRKSTLGSHFEVVFRGKSLGDFAVPLFGQHGILNALAVIGVSYMEQVDLDLIRQYLLTYQGVKRRFSEKQIGDITVIDDYAHHPTEITATLDAARQKYPNKPIIAIFQPHTFSRVIAYKDEFAESLEAADKVYLANIFGSAREQSGTISSEDLGAEISKFGGIVQEDNMRLLMPYDNAVMVFMGAGDIEKYEFAYEKLLGQLHTDLT